MHPIIAPLVAVVLTTAALGSAGLASPAFGQSADTVLLNGKIVTLDAAAPRAEALAVRDGKIVAVGSSADIRAFAGAGTRTVDLEGRTVVPGLIDSHMHAIRAALFYATEVNWIGTSSIPEAMERIKAAAQRSKPGQWIIVAGGWTEQQFVEKRRPTQVELLAAAPDNPVYVQLFYSAALLTPAGYKALNITSDADVPPSGKIERAADGTATGWILGDNPTISGLFDKLPLPTFDESVEGTRQFFRELNRLGITGVSDPGGFNMTAASYQPLFKLWEEAHSACGSCTACLRSVAAGSWRTTRPQRRCCRWASATTGCVSTASARTSPGACTTTTTPLRRRRSSFIKSTNGRRRAA